MSAEKFTLSNVLAKVNPANSRAKQPENSSNTENKTDIFSKHLDKNLSNIASPKNQALQNTDISAENDRAASIAKDNLEKDQLNQARAEKNIEKKLSEKQQREEARIEEQRKKDEETKEARANEEKKQASDTDETNNSSNTTEQTAITAINQPAIDDTTATETAGENEVLATDQTSVINPEATEATPDELLENTELTAEQLAALNSENTTNQEIDPALTANQANTDETATPSELTDESTIALSAVQTQSQTDATTQNKDTANKGAAIETAAKTGNGLESTLGQQDASENGANNKNNGQNGEAPKPLISDAAKKDVSLGANQQIQQALPQQGTNPQANAANNALFSNSLLAENSLKTAGLTSAAADITQVSSSDTPDQINNLNSSNTDLKQATPAQALRAAGYTSPTQSVAIQIAAKAQNGAQQFEIRLNPPELGRVDVRLEFTKDGQVNTHLIVERAETLDLLSKDARQLEQALQQAGVNIENDGLTFSLKDQGDNNQNQANEFDRQDNEQNASLNAEELQIDTNVIYRQLSSNSAIDISV